MKITIDFTDFLEADNGVTTFYGGTIKIDNEEVRADGSDRSFGNTQDEAIYDSLMDKFGIDEIDADEVHSAIFDVRSGQTIVTITKIDDGKILVESNTGRSQEVEVGAFK